MVDEIETYYFGKYDGFVDVNECTLYVIPHDITWKGTEAIKKELANQSGVPADKIRIKKFTGYTRTPNYEEESLKESANKKEVIDAIIANYGCTKKEAEKQYREMSDERKELLVKGFKDNAKKSFLNDSLKEDTVKQGSQWVNKGEEGTHGKFKTKKEADAQRKAMFSNRKPGATWGK